MLTAIETSDDGTEAAAVSQNAGEMQQEAGAQDGAAPYFDQAVFDLHYHLLAVRTEGLPPLPRPEDHGFSVDRLGNVTLITGPGQTA